MCNAIHMANGWIRATTYYLFARIKWVQGEVDVFVATKCWEIDCNLFRSEQKIWMDGCCVLKKIFGFKAMWFDGDLLKIAKKQ